MMFGSLDSCFQHILTRKMLLMMLLLLTQTGMHLIYLAPNCINTLHRGHAFVLYSFNGRSMQLFVDKIFNVVSIVGADSQHVVTALHALATLGACLLVHTQNYFPR